MDTRLQSPVMWSQGQEEEGSVEPAVVSEDQTLAENERRSQLFENLAHKTQELLL